jgi:hypothetical protein
VPAVPFWAALPGRGLPRVALPSPSASRLPSPRRQCVMKQEAWRRVRLTFTQKGGASVALGGEYGGFGANYKIWTASGRVF